MYSLPASCVGKLRLINKMQINTAEYVPVRMIKWGRFLGYPRIVALSEFICCTDATFLPSASIVLLFNTFCIADNPASTVTSVCLGTNGVATFLGTAIGLLNDEPCDSFDWTFSLIRFPLSAADSNPLNMKSRKIITNGAIIWSYIFINNYIYIYIYIYA